MLYKFMKDGKQVNSAIAQSKDAAIKINGGIEYDAIEEEPYEVATFNSSVSDNVLRTQPEKPPRQTRKDKGQPHKKAETKTRLKPEYFVAIDDILQTGSCSQDKAEEIISKAKDGLIRVIIGHEAKFTRQISFHIK